MSERQPAQRVRATYNVAFTVEVEQDAEETPFDEAFTADKAIRFLLEGIDSHPTESGVCLLKVKDVGNYGEQVSRKPVRKNR